MGSVDVLQPDAPNTIRHWVERGTNGFRLFTGGSAAAFDPSTLDDPRSFPSWPERCTEPGADIFSYRWVDSSLQQVRTEPPTNLAEQLP
nr:hypothetical protein [uncultured Steroidobacter sp.]